MSDEPTESQDKHLGEIQIAEMQRVFESFDKAALEIPQLFALIHQGIGIALEPLRDSLEALKIKVDALVEADRNNNN